MDIIQQAKSCRTLHGQIKIEKGGWCAHYRANHYFGPQNFLLLSFNISINQDTFYAAFLRMSRSFQRFYLKRYPCSFLFITSSDLNGARIILQVFAEVLEIAV